MFKKLLTLAAFAAAVVGANAEESWVNILTNGDAEGEYGEVPCAIGKVFGTDPTACTIEEEADGNHVFVVHATAKDSQTWDNQFWIMAPQTFKEGDKFKVSFRCKATKDAFATTQAHVAAGAYLHWACIGNIDFKADEWTEVSKTYTVDSYSDGMQSIAFNLSEFAEANDYYFDDIKLEIDENAVVIEAPENSIWFQGEPQVCDWYPNIIVVGAKKFANVAPGYTLGIQFVPADGTNFNLQLGGWGHAVINRWDCADILDLDEENNFFYLKLTSAMKEWSQVEDIKEGDVVVGTETKVYNIFEDLKSGGLILQGTITVAGLYLIPGEEDPGTSSISTIEAVDAAPVYYNLQGVRVENPNNGIYIVKRGNKVAKQVIK